MHGLCVRAIFFVLTPCRRFPITQRWYAQENGDRRGTAYLFSGFPDKNERKDDKALINDNLLEIIRADKQARARVAEASQCDERAAAQLEQARIRFENKYREDAERRIAASAAEHERVLASAAQDSAKNLGETEKNIRLLYEKKKDEWVRTIVCRVTEQ